MKHLAAIFHALGLIGFLAVFAVSVFLLAATKAQKEEFIDMWFLLKGAQENPIPCFIIIIVLLLTLGIAQVYHRQILKLRREENNRIGKEKSELQTILLGKTLNSSDDK